MKTKKLKTAEKLMAEVKERIDLSSHLIELHSTIAASHLAGGQLVETSVELVRHCREEKARLEGMLCAA